MTTSQKIPVTRVAVKDGARRASPPVAHIVILKSLARRLLKNETPALRTHWAAR